MKYNLESTIRQINESPQAATLMDQILPGMREKLAASPQTVNLSLAKVAIYAKDPVLKEKIQKLAEQLTYLGEIATAAETKRIQSYLNLAKSDRENITVHPHHQDAIYPGKPWLDENGHRIQAHGGAIFYENGTYYWYGEDKTHSLGYPQTSIWTWGIHAYQSKDLCNWSDLGLIIAPDLTNPDSSLFPEAHVDRPHIRKCEKTGKYVAWLKLSDDECFVVLQADRFTGPYHIVRDHYQPFDHAVGDFDIAIDENQTGYLFMDADHQGILGMQLTDDFLSCTREISWSYRGLKPPFTREGVALCEYQGKKYMFTSGMTGYVPNQSDCAVANSWEDEFESIGDPNVGTPDEIMSSFNSQFTQIFKLPNSVNLESTGVAIDKARLADANAAGMKSANVQTAGMDSINTETTGERWAKSKSHRPKSSIANPDTTDTPAFIALCDRWVPEYKVDAKRADMFRRVVASTNDPNYSCTDDERQQVANSPQMETANTSIADYVWLPVQFVDSQSGPAKPQIKWLVAWQPQVD